MLYVCSSVKLYEGKNRYRLKLKNVDLETKIQSFHYALRHSAIA